MLKYLLKHLCVLPVFKGNTAQYVVGKVYNFSQVPQGLEPHFKCIDSLVYADFYEEYRGKCKELSEALLNKYPEHFTLVRGHVLEFEWGTTEPHWWLKDTQGVVHDPSCLQFQCYPSMHYIEFDGNVECAQCGKILPEERAIFMGNYPTCSDKCARTLVGI